MFFCYEVTYMCSYFVSTSISLSLSLSLLDTPGPVQYMTADLDEQTGNIEVTWSAPANLTLKVLAYKLTNQIVGIGDCDDVYQGPVKTEFLADNLFTFTLRALHFWRNYRITVAAIVADGESRVTEKIVASRESRE